MSSTFFILLMFIHARHKKVLHDVRPLTTACYWSSALSINDATDFALEIACARSK